MVRHQRQDGAARGHHRVLVIAADRRIPHRAMVVAAVIGIGLFD